MPIPLIGFNDKVAWTHTFSTDNRFTLRYLALDPGNPTRYIKDGKPVAMAVVLLNPQSQKLRLTLDGRVLEVKAPAVLISNNVYENSAWLKQGALDEGVLGIYMVKPMSSLAYLRLALDLLRGRWRDNLNVREDRARSVTIERHRRFGRRAKSIRATLDGELRLLPLPLTITSDPAALEVLVPAPAGALEGISEGTGGR